MPTRLLRPLAAAAVAVAVVSGASRAWANDGFGQGGTASAGTGSGGVTVSAGYQAWLPASSSLAGQAAVVTDLVSGGGATVNPNTPYGCRYQVAPPSALSLLGPGSSGGGQWVFPICGGPGVLNPLPAIWVPFRRPAVPVAPAASLLALAQQAVSHLGLPALSIHLAPPANRDQLVGLASWLWVTGWTDRSAKATAGPVSARVTAAPVEVVWDLAGHRVVCAGAGTPYRPGTPAGDQHTSCSYTWTHSSAGAPGGTVAVTATVYWQLSWTATGAPGGGSLGRLAGPPARVAVAVAEAQAINTTGANSD